PIHAQPFAGGIEARTASGPADRPRSIVPPTDSRPDVADTADRRDAVGPVRRGGDRAGPLAPKQVSESPDDALAGPPRRIKQDRPQSRRGRADVIVLAIVADQQHLLRPATERPHERGEEFRRRFSPA